MLNGHQAMDWIGKSFFFGVVFVAIGALSSTQAITVAGAAMMAPLFISIILGICGGLAGAAQEALAPVIGDALARVAFWLVAVILLCLFLFGTADIDGPRFWGSL
jgi:hypothetical protein